MFGTYVCITECLCARAYVGTYGKAIAAIPSAASCTIAALKEAAKVGGVEEISRRKGEEINHFCVEE